MGDPHGAELGAFESLLGEGFIVHSAGGFNLCHSRTLPSCYQLLPVITGEAVKKKNQKEGIFWSDRVAFPRRYHPVQVPILSLVENETPLARKESIGRTILVVDPIVL